MPRTKKLPRATVLQRLRDVRRWYLHWQRRLQAEHGALWHQHTAKLERYEAKGLELTRQLPSCPEWWTLPCECRKCLEETC